MVFIRAYSIQDIIRNINRRLTFYDTSSLFAFVFLSFVVFIVIRAEEGQQYRAVTYIENNNENIEQTRVGFQIYGSKSGKTYTYSWCKGASRTKEVNRIYFNTELEAKGTGRTLSKLCK